MKYRQVRTIACGSGGSESSAGALRGIALDGRDRLYVAGESGVEVFDADGKRQRGWCLTRPGWCITVDGDRAAWVGQDGQVEIFDLQGTRIETWKDPRLGQVTAIGFLKDGVIVADARDRLLRHFSRGRGFRNDIGVHAGGRPFMIPNGVLDFSIDSAGVLHAANPGRHRVERFQPDGELRGHFGRFDGRDPAGFAGCCNPTNVTVAADGDVFVTEKAPPRVKRYSPNGELRAIVCDSGFDPGCKNMDVALDFRGRVYVLDTVRLEIRVFALEQAETAEGAGT